MTLTRISVLDKGFVQLLDHMGSDEDVVAAARTSTGRGFVSWEPYQRCERCALTGSLESTPMSPLHANACFHEFKHFPRGDAGILEYLYKNRHMTPFEMCVVKVLVKAPIFVLRQWHRHRAQSINEMSARYTQLPDEFYVPTEAEVKGQSASNKQGSAGELPADVADDFIKSSIAKQTIAYEDYERDIGRGVSRELARINLPVAVYSTQVVLMNLRMALHFLGLRDDSHAQGQMQAYGAAFATIIQQLWPRTYALYEEHTKYAKTFSRSELDLLNKMMTGLQWSDEDKANYDAMMKLVSKIKSGQLQR